MELTVWIISGRFNGRILTNLYHHPDFSLCSATLLGHKVFVPCETELVIATEYGSNWMEPVTSWNYEKSIKNRGPNIYWEKSMVEKVYQNN
ncbi:fukutin [Trichonephila inaurata madagascariensis]|uniref:Fukutin n=1 Tax=Trichonephila inaurata madagascariensis TaxID=2747483 RepID=A0A8X6XQF0_9ARAC|nr:fukutin [Trichonephila inaurata madagascariensis]